MIPVWFLFDSSHMIPDSITVAVIWFQIRLLLQSYDSRFAYCCSHDSRFDYCCSHMIPGSITVAVIWFQIRLLLQSYDSSLSENIRDYSVSTARNFSKNYSFFGGFEMLSFAANFAQALNECSQTLCLVCIEKNLYYFRNNF